MAICRWLYILSIGAASVPPTWLRRNTDIIETGSQLSYPTSLYYMTNAFPIDYTSSAVTDGSWGTDGLWTSGVRATISAATTKIALNKTVNYAVGRLDVKVKANADVLKANAADGTSETM